MPRDVDHIVETHQLARQRVAAGLPVWAHTINLKDVWRNDNYTFPERRDVIVARLRRSNWFTGRDTSGFDELGEVVANLADAEDGTEFDEWWDELYDHADRDRVWIATFLGGTPCTTTTTTRRSPSTPRRRRLLRSGRVGTVPPARSSTRRSD